MTGRRNDSMLRVSAPSGEDLPIVSGQTYPPETRVEIETDRIRAQVATSGYVSGVVGGSFEDKKTGAKDLGFGLDVVDFLLEPAPEGEPVPEGQYDFGNLVHGDIPKRYVEGPQICTQVRRLAPQVFVGDEFVAVRLRHAWTDAYAPHERAGSIWEQTLIFPEGERFFLAADRVTTVSASPNLFLRIDLPGHLKHANGSEFAQMYLSYEEPATIPSSEFVGDFPPDARFLYQRGAGAMPARMIRAYQHAKGPWLAGMTLNPGDVSEAWCHQRGYVCMIQEIGGRATRPGDTFGAAYVIGWFDTIEEMHAVYDRYRGVSGWMLEGRPGRPARYRGLAAGAVSRIEE
jgi:hypothetical protein